MLKKIKAAAIAATLALAAAAPLQMAAQATAAFTDAPEGVFPLLDRNTRLDMIEYFASGMANASENRIGGKSRVTAVTPMSVEVEMTEASRYQLALLPAGSDTLYAVITTVLTPAPDSRLDLYNSHWEKLPSENFFTKPALADWLTPDGRKNYGEVETFVPFLLIGYAYTPENNTLTLTNNTRAFLSDDIYSIVGGNLLDTLTYVWNGKRFRK